MRDGYLRGSLPRTPTARQIDVLAAFVATGGSVQDAAELVGIRPSTVKRHLADLRARSGLTTEQLIYRGRAEGWLAVPTLENHSLEDCRRALTPNGTLVLMSGTGASGLALLVRLIRPVVLSPFVKHSLRRPYSNPNHKDLEVLTSMVEAGTLRSVVEATYPLSEAAAAIGHIEAGHARGKVVVAI